MTLIILVLLNSFTHLFIQQIFTNSYHMPGTILNAEDITTNKRDRNPCPCGVYVRVQGESGKTQEKYVMKNKICSRLKETKEMLPSTMCKPWFDPGSDNKQLLNIFENNGGNCNLYWMLDDVIELFIFLNVIMTLGLCRRIEECSYS